MLQKTLSMYVYLKNYYHLTLFSILVTYDHHRYSYLIA